jgi:hypothetical protein
MAHTCPDCGCLCHCKGDIDDIELGYEPAGGCVHYKSPDCKRDDDWVDSDLYDRQDPWPDDEELIDKKDTE